MSVHSLGPRLVAQPPERICSKLVLLVPGVCNQPHLMLSRRTRSVRGLPDSSGLHQHQESISNFRISSSASHLFFTFSFLWISPTAVEIPSCRWLPFEQVPSFQKRGKSPSLTCREARPNMRREQSRSRTMTTIRIPAFAVMILASRLLLAPPQYAQEITSQAVSDAVDRVAPAMIEVRHQIHQHPELSNREFETSKLVAERLRGLGLEVLTGIAHTGVVGILKGGRPGPIVAVRSELDALPVTEDTDLPFKSTVRSEYNGQPVGVAHACGHDIHIATILGVATVLSSMREQLPGTVIFIFQPAEEGVPKGETGGAKEMLKEGIFDKLRPDAVFGLHAAGLMDVGQITYTLGPTTSADTTFTIEFHGKQSHAAFPQESVDPVVMASEAVMQ